MAALVALLTDFGWRDGYVGAMKGVLLARAPGLQLVDVSHDVPPGDVAAAAYVLQQAAPHFPPETIHLVVVDPGVGSARRALALRAGKQLFVGPDNGVFSAPLRGDAVCTAHEIRAPAFAPPDASPVFHGRDLFAPAAAHLAGGGRLEELGPAVEASALVRLPWPAPRQEGEQWRAVVIHIDRFGNLITSLALPAAVPASARARAAGREIRFGRTYGDVAPGELIALRGSSGLLEIACNGSSAAERLGLARGAVVEFGPVAPR